MENNDRPFLPGDMVFFIQNDKVRYNKIKKIAFTADGPIAMFEGGCVRDYGVLCSQLYRTKKELKKEMQK